MPADRPGPWTLDKVKKRLRAEQVQRKTLAAARYRLEEDQQRARVVKLIKSDKSFAVLMPISVTSEIARLENVDGESCHDLELAKKVSIMSKITLASSVEVWLINLPGEPFNHFYSNGMEGLGLNDRSSGSLHGTVIMDSISFPVTRSSRRLNPSVSETQVIRNEPISATHADWVSIHTPAAEAIVSGDRHAEEHGISSVAPVHENGTIKWSNVPRQPIPKLDDVSLWIGHQLKHERMPAKYQHMAPEGELIASLDRHPEGLLLYRVIIL
jgi:hypothetical protein